VVRQQRVRTEGGSKGPAFPTEDGVGCAIDPPHEGWRCRERFRQQPRGRSVHDVL
ncbi:MAG: hypothetical protein AVDCRST_MAG91-3217, partial [uncultured Sphingomonadaceae bacterium]